MSFLNRVKQGIAAAVGTAAIMAMTIFRIATAREQEVHILGATAVTMVTASVAGILWSLMPRAADPLSESLDAVKEELHPAVTKTISMALDIDEEDEDEDEDVPPSKNRGINDDDIWGKP